MKLILVFIFSTLYSQSLQPDAILKNTFYSAMSSIRGHAHTTYQKTPMNMYFNPAGLAGLKKQIGLAELSTYVNSKEYPDSETYYPFSINSLMIAAPFSSNAPTFTVGFSLRAPLLNSYEYTNDVIGASYSESYQYWLIGFTFAQQLSHQVDIGFTYSTMTGSTKIEKRSADTFSRKRKDEIKILESPRMLIFGLHYKPDEDLIFGLTWQSSANMRLKDSRLNDRNGYELNVAPLIKLGTKYRVGELTELYLDYHRISTNGENALNSSNAGFDLDIFEDLGFGLGVVMFEPINLDDIALTGGISFTSENYRFYISMDYSRSNRRAFYFNHTETSRYLLQGTVEHDF